jgi:hypothetical protein
LPKNTFIQKETLVWSDILFRQDYVVIHLKITKTKVQKGEHIDLFTQPGCAYCPVKALTRLNSLRVKSGNNVPVFTLSNGTFLTQSKLNGLLLDLLKPVLGVNAALITGHSFRAGLAALMASNPEIATESDICLWGRWNSSAYTSYTRLKLSQKRAIFNKIVYLLNKNS